MSVLQIYLKKRDFKYTQKVTVLTVHRSLPYLVKVTGTLARVEVAIEGSRHVEGVQDPVVQTPSRLHQFLIVDRQFPLFGLCVCVCVKLMKKRERCII